MNVLRLQIPRPTCIATIIQYCCPVAGNALYRQKTLVSRLLPKQSSFIPLRSRRKSCRRAIFQRGRFVRPFLGSVDRDAARSCRWLPFLSVKYGGVEIALRDPQASRCKHGSHGKSSPLAHRPTAAVHLTPLRKKNSVGGCTSTISRPRLFLGLDQGNRRIHPYPTPITY